MANTNQSDLKLSPGCWTHTHTHTGLMWIYLNRLHQKDRERKIMHVAKIERNWICFDKRNYAQAKNTKQFSLITSIASVFTELYWFMNNCLFSSFQRGFTRTHNNTKRASNIDEQQNPTQFHSSKNYKRKRGQNLMFIRIKIKNNKTVRYSLSLFLTLN